MSWFGQPPSRRGTPICGSGSSTQPCSSRASSSARTRWRRSTTVTSRCSGPTTGGRSACYRSWTELPALGDAAGIGHAQIGEPRVHPVALDHDPIVLDVAELLQLREDVLERVDRLLDHRVQDQLRVLRRLVRIVDPGEARDLAGERLLVQALRVAVLRELLHRGVHVDLDELADELTVRVPGGPIRADRAADRRDAVAGEQVRDEPDPQDVRIAVLLGEPEALAQVLADDVAVQDLGLETPSLELVIEHLGDRGLARPGQAGEPD